MLRTTSDARFERRPANRETLSLTSSLKSYKLDELKFELIVGFVWDVCRPKKSSELILVEPSKRRFVDRLSNCVKQNKIFENIMKCLLTSDLSFPKY